MTTARDRVLTAVREAAEDSPLEDLTPAEIARRAGVHRVTFYRFWPDAPSAAIEAFTDEIDHLVATDDLFTTSTPTLGELAQIYDGILERSLVEIRDRRHIYRILFAWPAFQAHVHDALRSRASIMVDTLQRSGATVSGAVTGTAAGFLAGASLGVLMAWTLDDDPDAHRRALEVVQQMPPWWPSR